MPADTSLSHDRVSGRYRLLKSFGGGAAVLIGPAVGLVAWKAYGMDALQAAALAFLLSGWLLPRLLSSLVRRDA